MELAIVIACLAFLAIGSIVGYCAGETRLLDPYDLTDKDHDHEH